MLRRGRIYAAADGRNKDLDHGRYLVKLNLRRGRSGRRCIGRTQQGRQSRQAAEQAQPP